MTWDPSKPHLHSTSIYAFVALLHNAPDDAVMK